MTTAPLIGSDRDKMHVGLSLFSFTTSKNIRLVFCDDSMLVPVYKIGEVHFPLLGTNGFHAKAKNERFTATGPDRVVVRTCKIETFHVVVCQITSNIAPKSVPHVQHDYFSSVDGAYH